MAEYILREAAIKRFNFAVLDCLGMEPTIRAGDIIKALESIPAADVRTVVVCKDCKYFSEVMYKGTQFEYGYCDRWADGTRMNPEDFCSHAAKREET